MSRFSLGLNQRRLNGTTAVGSPAINLGATRGKGSSTRMFNYCTNTSPAPSLCINQFITITDKEPSTPSGPTVPGAPVITFITSGDQELIINFTAPSDGGSQITDYLYSINGGASFTSSGDLTSPITITGLANNVTYQISIKAVNDIGQGNASNNVSGTPIPDNQGWFELGADAQTPFTSLYTTTGTVRAVKYNSNVNKVYAVGDFKNSLGVEFVAVYDIATNTWSELGDIYGIIGATGSIKAIGFDTNNDVYIAGDFQNTSLVQFVAKYSNNSWSELGNLASDTNMIPGSINCLNIDTDNNVYVAGAFKYTDLNGTWRYVAKYTPSSNVWTRLPASPSIGGQQFNGDLYAITSYTTAQGIFVQVVGDAIATAGGGSNNPVGIRRVWTYFAGFSQFLPDGAGEWPTFNRQTYMFNGPGYAIDSDPGGNVYTGGAFTFENNINATNNQYFIARSQWQPVNNSNSQFLGPTYNGPIRTIYSKNFLFVAGEFTNGSNPYVANGFTGTQVGYQSTFFNSSILSIDYNAPLGRLYAGGNFTNNQGKNFVALHIP